MPNSIATARGHLNKTIVAQPHAESQSVSAQRRHFNKAKSTNVTKIEKSSSKLDKPFDPASVPRSTTIHLDYTGRLPQRGSQGTLYYLVACWGSYIHFGPLTTMKGSDTASAIKSAIMFFGSTTYTSIKYEWTINRALRYGKWSQN